MDANRPVRSANQRRVDEAILNVCRVSNSLKLIGVLIEGGGTDIGEYRYHIEETLFFLSDALSDSFCTLNEAGIKVEG